MQFCKLIRKLALNFLIFHFQSQEKLDDLLLELDGTINKSRLGGNTILSISVAFAKAFAKACSKYLFQTIANNNFNLTLPKPMLNVINGGVHADNELSVQEFMIVPVKYDKISQNLKIACEIFHTLRRILRKNLYMVNIGDEGGFAPNIKSTKQALDIIIQAIEKAGYKLETEVCLSLDIAANELYNNGKYEFKEEKQEFTTTELMKFYEEICIKYPIISLEDPFSESDLSGWKMITKKLGKKIKIVGDDLFVTNSEKLQKGISQELANSILIKINQIGTLTETLKSIKLARKNNFIHIISHRSGETEDTTIAHLAVGTNSPYIKSGSISRTDRVCKYNELIRIEERILKNKHGI